MSNSLQIKALLQQGACIFPDVADAQSAQHTLESFITCLQQEQSLFCRDFLGKAQCLQTEMIPYESAREANQGFQPLHFDMGHPLLSGVPQIIFCLTGLYCPPQQENLQAKTRLVFLPELLRQRSWPSAPILESRLLDYVDRFSPDYRLWLLGRALAVLLTPELADSLCKQPEYEYYQTVQQAGMATEYQVYQACGLDVAAIEKTIQLQPGMLLIIDNTRVIHGRVGSRQPNELVQFLYGLENAPASHIEVLRHLLVSQFARAEIAGEPLVVP